MTFHIYHIRIRLARPIPFMAEADSRKHCLPIVMNHLPTTLDNICCHESSSMVVMNLLLVILYQALVRSSASMLYDLAC